MTQWKAMSKLVRLSVCFCILGSAVLFLGAVKVRDGVKTHQQECAEALDSCRRTVIALQPGLPEDQQKSWERLVQQDPEFCLKLTCGKLSLTDAGKNP